MLLITITTHTLNCAISHKQQTNQKQIITDRETIRRNKIEHEAAMIRDQLFLCEMHRIRAQLFRSDLTNRYPALYGYIEHMNNHTCYDTIQSDEQS